VQASPFDEKDASMKRLAILALFALVANAGAAETLLGKGSFHGGNYAPADTASGSVSLVKLENGSYELRLGDDFSTTPGPDLFVYLSASADPANGDAITGNDYIDAGKLASPTGSQKLSLPSNFNPAKFKSIAIWCKQFSILFGAAALSK
jgi:hypothetical protein